MAKQANDPLGDLKEVQSNWIKWGKIGDFIRGTLTDIFEQDDQFHEGEKQKVYEVKAQVGLFHDAEGNAVEIKEGEFWNVGGRPSINRMTKNLQRGQIVAFQFNKEVPSKKFKGKTAKSFVVKAGGMDPNYKGEDSKTEDIEEVPFD